MATIIVRHDLPPGSIVQGTSGADTFILNGQLGLTIVGLGGNDVINPGIPNPHQFSNPSVTYTTIYGDGLAHGSPHPDALEGNWRGSDVIAFGYGFIAKGGPGFDRYEFHGTGPNGPLVARAPQIDIAEDTLWMDRSDDHRAPDGFRAYDWDVIRLDADSFRVRGVHVRAFSENPIVGEQNALLGFLPTGHGERHHYFDVTADTPHEAMAVANEELHAMAHEGLFLL